MRLGFGFIFVLILLAGCSTRPSNPDAVRDRAADATAAIKRDSKAIAQGIREGWSRDKSLMDLNTASREDLQTLPGVNARLAEQIIAHRPYTRSSELLDKHIMSKQEYAKIADQVTAKR